LRANTTFRNGTWGSPSCRSFLENAEGQLHGSPRSGAQRIGRDHSYRQLLSKGSGIAKFLKNKISVTRFSLGIDRDQLNEAFWLGVGNLRIDSAAPIRSYSPLVPSE